MASYRSHPEEEKTVDRLLRYFMVHRGSWVMITYANGESYRCKFYSSYDCDNENELEDGTESEPDNFFAIALDPIETIAPGPHHKTPGSLIEVSYRDFPLKIVGGNGERII